MTTPPLRVERRVGQRFPYLLAVSLREPATSLEGVGVTQDLSSRGVFFFTDVQLAEGAEIELTLRMPSEITLGESMPVRCRARVSASCGRMAVLLARWDPNPRSESLFASRTTNTCRCHRSHRPTLPAFPLFIPIAPKSVPQSIPPLVQRSINSNRAAADA